MGAWRGNMKDVDWVYVDAPYSATGPPDEGIAMFYPDRDYFEWFLREDRDNKPTSEEHKKLAPTGLEQSYKKVLKILRDEGPFDGILGFSQGAGMVSRIARLRQDKEIADDLFRFCILIGGVPAYELEERSLRDPILLPSLHIVGLADDLLPLSRRLHNMFQTGTGTLLEHSEGHNIPSIRTNLYQAVLAWIISQG